MEKNLPKIYSIVVDSNVLIALQRRDDTLYNRAKKIAKDLEKTKVVFVANNYLIAEVLTVLFLKTKSLRAPLSFGRMVYEKRNPWFKIYEIGPALQRKAWKIFKSQKRSDRLSFVDCTLPVLAHELGIKTIFSFDEKFKVFKKMGIEILI